MKTPLVAPSLLSADFAHLGTAIELVNKSEADWFHLDVMDGVFVPNISFGIPVVAAIAKHAQKPLDVHLMIVQPERYISAFATAGAHILTVHYEACIHLHRTLQTIKEEGLKAGVAINPHTPVNLLEPLISDIDVVCLMSVNPGFGGQAFIEHTYTKIYQLRELINAAHTNTLIEIDGGVTDQNAQALVQAGADALVAGNFVFHNENPVHAIHCLKYPALL